jgi:hypothetical protein
LGKFILLAITFMAPCRAQAPAPVEKPVEKKGSISGQVLSASGGPVRKARIRLQQTGGSTPHVDLNAATLQPAPELFIVESDASGGFTFDNLDSGSYVLSIDRAGFVSQRYPPISTGDGCCRRVEVAPGQDVTGVSIKLIPEGAISGRITDRDGDPFAHAEVTLYRLTYGVHGRQLNSIGTSETRSDGSYVIDGLSAGRYVLAARDFLGGSVYFAPGSKGAEEVYVSTFYPHTQDASTASPIQVTPGAQLRGVDIQIIRTQVFQIRGKVVGVQPGGGPTEAMLVVSPKTLNGSLETPGPAVPTRNGVFQTGPLPPGEYVIEARPYTYTANGVTTKVASKGLQTVTLGNADVTVTLRVGPGAEVTGRVMVEGEPPKGQASPGRAPTVSFVSPDDPREVAESGRANNDGTFAVHELPPAKYGVSIGGLPQGIYVKSIRFQNRDVTRGEVDLSSGSGGTMEVVLSYNAAELDGVVRDGEGTVTPGMVVSLVEAGSQSGGRPARIRNTRSDARGSFKFEGLAPGEYRVLAWEETDQMFLNYPEFREKFASKAVSISLGESSQQRADVKLIPRADIEAAAAELP